MGCKIGCSKATTSNRRVNELNRQRIEVNPNDTVVDGICLKAANVGHYFLENELVEVKRKTLTQRMNKWLNMCSYFSLFSSNI